MTKNNCKDFISRISIVLLLLVLTSCNKDNQFDVAFYYPDANTNGVLTRFLVKYALDEYGVPIPASKAIALTDAMQKRFFGGVGIAGTLTINANSVQFEPVIGNQLMGQGFKYFEIPIKDIQEVKSESSFIITKAVIVNTISGQFKFQLAEQKHWYTPFQYQDEDICNMIKEQMKK